MTGERWSRIRDVFLQAIDVPESDRAAFLDSACRGDDELRLEVASLLSCDTPGDALVDIPAVPEAVELDSGRDGELVDRLIGPYRIVRLIGHGGMGSVYLGVRDDKQYRKQVAIKLLKRGMDTEFMLSRFRQERQILADLEHPFIARLLDGGATADGLPYFVMEYVDGVPLTQFCAGNQLSIPERLRLFGLVCEAVQYAHQNLVVHRDIKPSNILTTREGLPKLLDFGIAKVIDKDRDTTMTLTGPGFRLLTPDYASPEHVMGGRITTASDIYSLGAVLYELLSGVRPHRFAAASIAELENAICRTDPEKPSSAAGKNDAFPSDVRKQFQRQIAGDLDSIVLTALAKEPALRYASAAELAADLNRHLEGLPIAARENRFTYQASKFVRRYRVAIAVLVLILTSLSIGVIATTVQAQRAERRFQLVRGLANSLLFELHDEMARLPGSTALQARTVQTVVKYLDELTADGARDDHLDLEVAIAYERAGALEGHPFRSNLGHGPAALSNYRKALAIYERLAERSQVRAAAVRGLIDTNLYAGAMESFLGNPGAAGAHYRKASAVADAAIARRDAEIPQGTQINIYFRLADAEYERGDATRELAHYRKAQEIARAWVDTSGSADAIANLREATQNVASAQARTGDLRDARASFQKALEVAGRLAQRTDIREEQKVSVISLHNSFGDLLGATDDPNLVERTEALAQYGIAMGLAEQFARIDRQNVNARRNLAACHRRMGMMLVDNDPERGLAHYRAALSIAEDLSSGDPQNVEYLYAVSRGCMGTGEGLHKMGRNAEAIALLDRAVEIQSAIAASSPERIWNLRVLSRSYTLLSAALLSNGQPERALTALYRGLETADQILQRAPSSLYHQLDRADVLEAMGRHYAALSRQLKVTAAMRARLRQQARARYEESLAIWRNWKARNLAVAYASQRESRAMAAIASLAKLAAPSNSNADR